MGQPLGRGALENSFRKLGSNCGEQLCGIAAALTDSCFEERQLWGVALESNFWKPLSETTFGGRLSNFGAQLSGAALQNGFGETFWQTGLQNRSFRATALENSFGHNFVDQRRGTALGSSFREQL